VFDLRGGEGGSRRTDLVVRARVPRSTSASRYEREIFEPLVEVVDEMLLRGSGEIEAESASATQIVISMNIRD